MKTHFSHWTAVIGAFLIGLVLGAWTGRFGEQLGLHDIVEERNAIAVHYSHVAAIYAALRYFQETQTYRDMARGEGGDWLVFDESFERSLYALLRTPGNSPHGGHLMHVPGESVFDGAFVNPWGKPYRAAVYVSPGSNDASLLRELRFRPGEAGSFILVFSETDVDGHALLLIQREESEGEESEGVRRTGR